MTQNHNHQDASRKPARGGGPAIVMMVILYAAGLGLSVYLALRPEYFHLGAIGVLLVLTLAPVAFSLLLGGRQRVLIERVDELTRLVRSFTDLASLSEDARRVLSRRNDRELLTQAIEEDIANRNWDAAMVLVKELAERFGYRSDAEEFRRKIDSARAETLDKEVTDAVAYLDGLIIQRRWDAAYADAAKLLRLYPDSPRVFGLRGRVEQAQRSCKDDLERRFLAAAKDDKADEAMALLKELDGYLTPIQAEPLRELARGVIGKAREHLGAQFKSAVEDRDWRTAARLGERIIIDFPNSRMATEVRDVIDGIRIRANQM
jgi:tetratricopeptide (TPR) repeat protein